MSEKKFVKVGKIHSAQGIKGEVFVHLFAGEAAWLGQLNQLCLSPAEDEQPLRFLTIERKRVHQKAQKWGLAIKLAEISDRNQAEELVGQLVFVPENFLASNSGENIYLREILGFLVIDERRGEVGSVVGFADNGAQDLLAIENSQGVAFTVPLVEPILRNIDFPQRTILMDIPQGLLPEDGQ